MTSRRWTFIQVSQLTKCPLYVSPFLSSINWEQKCMCQIKGLKGDSIKKGFFQKTKNFSECLPWGVPALLSIVKEATSCSFLEGSLSSRTRFCSLFSLCPLPLRAQWPSRSLLSLSSSSFFSRETKTDFPNQVKKFKFEPADLKLWENFDISFFSGGGGGSCFLFFFSGEKRVDSTY